MLSLQDIKGPYHAIFSLGNNCLPGIELREHGLRRFAGPIDWMGTPVSAKYQECFAIGLKACWCIPTYSWLIRLVKSCIISGIKNTTSILTMIFMCITISLPICWDIRMLRLNMIVELPDFCRRWEAGPHSLYPNRFQPRGY